MKRRLSNRANRAPAAPPRKRPNARPNKHAAYLASLERRIRAMINSNNNGYIRNKGAGPYDMVELKYSPMSRRLILKSVQTKETERRKGHFKRLLNMMNRLAAEKNVHSVEIQSILSPHIRGMLPWRGFPIIENYGNSSVKRYRQPQSLF